MHLELLSIVRNNKRVEREVYVVSTFLNYNLRGNLKCEEKRTSRSRTLKL